MTVNHHVSKCSRSPLNVGGLAPISLSRGPGPAAGAAACPYWAIGLSGGRLEIRGDGVGMEAGV
jgi:hypothetical protein